jgi:serine/threonine protein kinase
MSLAPTRWHVIAESNFAWEREAQEWLREQLPNYDPWHVWTNFEFIDDEGKVNDVDALILSPAGLFLVEIKSRPGEVRGDAHTWTWRTEGREFSVDNPLLLTDRKAKRLASILRRQPAITKAKVRPPFIEPLVFLSATRLSCHLQDRARAGVVLRGSPGRADDDGIVKELSSGGRNAGQPSANTQQIKALAKALAEAGIRPSNKHRTVGEYRLLKLLREGESYQDWLGQHISVESVQRRVRIHTLASAQSADARQSRVRSAKREFEMLEGIEHSGILRCREYKETELGPALVFDHDPAALRLDHLMHEHGARLSISQRLQLVREIAEVLSFAHGKRLYHRALAPQNVLIRGWPKGELRVQLMNWQAASRNADDPSTLHRTTGTKHVEDYVEDPGLVYLAPETAHAESGHNAELDVYSLGSLAYLVFSGQAPAEDLLSLQKLLRQGQGLQLTDVLDSCTPKLADLIRYATNPDINARYDHIEGFLDDLEAVEDELTTPDPEASVDPSVARPGERLEGGFIVVSRLGRGSSADVLLVKRDTDKDALALKVATDASHNDALRAEAQALGKLRHSNIVGWEQTLEIAGRTALLLRSAGEETLGRFIKRNGRVSLDLLQRFGEELIEVVRELEKEAVIHRDIKPENIGVSKSGSGRLKLVLFDFSLSRTPVENINAGTPPYLDPFLSLRSHRRWDLYAERYAAAVTLHEMAVGRPPRFGDGQSAAAVLDVEASIESDAFDPNLRDPLTAFFAKALKRDFRERFDNAEDMLRAWRGVFERANAAVVSPNPAAGFESLARTLSAATNMAELGYSLDAQDVLSRMGVNNVRELLGVDRVRFRYLKSVGDRIRREIREKAKELARLRPELVPGHSSPYEQDDADSLDSKLLVSINELADVLLPRRTASSETPEDEALEHYLGLDDSVKAGVWPTPGKAAGAGQITRQAFTSALVKARERWLKMPPFTELRAQLHALIIAQGAVMTALELAEAALTLRGCALQQDELRLRLASAVVRAAVEAEAQLEKPRFEAFEHQPVNLIATHLGWAHYARQLGSKADGCALADPLLSPARALEALRQLPLPQDLPLDAGTSTLSSARLLRLATSASMDAALSSRQEIYRRRMPCLQALKQSLNSLIGIREIKHADLLARVRGRYPEAEPLPPQRQLLDRLLEEAGAPLVWNPECAGGGAYVTRELDSTLSVSTANRLQRQRTGSDPDAARGLVADAERLEQRLQHKLRQGGLLVLSIEPARASDAQCELLRRFGGAGQGTLTPLNLDALLLAAMKAQVAALGAEWGVVLRADNAAAQSVDAHRLQQLVQRCLPALRSALLDSTQPLLLLHPGLLARFELLHLIAELEAEVGRPGRTPALWLLLPTPQPQVASIDGQILPLVLEASFAAIPRAWLENQHRAAA